MATRNPLYELFGRMTCGRSEYVKVRLSKAELTWLESKSRESDRSVSVYVRDLMRGDRDRGKGKVA